MHGTHTLGEINNKTKEKQKEKQEEESEKRKEIEKVPSKRQRNAGERVAFSGKRRLSFCCDNVVVLHLGALVFRLVLFLIKDKHRVHCLFESGLTVV